MGKAVDAMKNGALMSDGRAERKAENQRQWRSAGAIHRLEEYLAAGGPVNEDGETPDREAVIIALWELERVRYGKKQSYVDLELKRYVRAKRVVNKL